MEKIFPVLNTATIFMLVFLLISPPSEYGNAQTEDKGNEGVIIFTCTMSNAIDNYLESTTGETGSDDDFVQNCNNDMLYLYGQCESSNFEQDYCSDVLSDFIEERELDNVDRPDQLTDQGERQLRNLPNPQSGNDN